MIKNIIIIPARYASTRLPKKMLLDLNGKTLIKRVYENAIKSKMAQEVFIAVDSKEIYKECINFTRNVIMTNENLNSGTERIIEALNIIKNKKENKYKNLKNIINIQGDEPFIDIKLIDNIFLMLEKQKNNTMITVKKEIKKEKEINDINNVKVITNINNEAIYFSRLAIPFNRDKLKNNVKYYKHIGIYGYKYNFLQKIKNLKQSILEETEKLEQLKIIENGYKIKLIETKEEVIGIDTIEDLERARIYMLNNKKS